MTAKTWVHGFIMCVYVAVVFMVDTAVFGDIDNIRRSFLCLSGIGAVLLGRHLQEVRHG